MSLFEYRVGHESADQESRKHAEVGRRCGRATSPIHVKELSFDELDATLIFLLPKALSTNALASLKHFSMQVSAAWILWSLRKFSSRATGPSLRLLSSTSARIAY